MQNPPIEQLENSSNKKLWIILGSLIGVLLIIMSGCVACGALIGLSALNNEGRSSNSRGTSSWGGGGLASSSWKGTLSCDDDTSTPVIFKFAPSGNPLYDYRTSSGLREVELEKAGQSIRFAAAGGGVTNITVESIDVTSDEMNYTLRVSYERAASGTMIQSRSSNTTRAKVSGSQLELEMTIRSSSAASQPGYVVPDESTTKCIAELSKQ